MMIGEPTQDDRTMPMASQSLKEVFLEALAIATPERTAWLDRKCSGDQQLRRQVELMLAAHDQPQSLLDREVSPEIEAQAPTENHANAEFERAGNSIGPYKLLEQLGEGGFGIVFMAEQTHPVRRKVALKILKPGCDTRQVVARFEAERQALAIMDHPNIAKVFDGGTTPSGRPYFVMELVRGAPITEFCDQNHLTPRQRLELFISVCQAVQHAHQKGIIHRDLKPSNIMVSRHDTTPVVKVIDFGIAKALGQELTEKTLFTGLAQMVGTPLYMSPEQAGMSDLDVDTRSDIYSLGVVLYELLTSTTPFDKERFKKAAYDEIRRIIREEEPPRPSTRLNELSRVHGPTQTDNAVRPVAPISSLASVSALRQTEPSRLTKLVRGELDWIVMKALDKDRNRRYETANGFAMDLQRYLAGEAVQAVPPSTGYRLRKFVRRHRTGLAVAGLLFLSAGIVAAAASWVVLDRAARWAETGRQTEVALRDAHRFRERQEWAQCQEATKRAALLLGPGEGHAELRHRLRDLDADLDMVERLERIRLEQTGTKADWWDHASADLSYEAAFRDYGVGLGADEVDAAVERVRASAICGLLVAALDDWAWAIPKADPGRRERIRALASGVDTDAWRVRFRDPAVQRDRRALEELASRPEVVDQPPATAVLVGRALLECRSPVKAIEVLAAAQRRYPADFWLNVVLATALNYHLQPPRRDEAIGYIRAALAIRPTAAGIHSGLGHCLLTAGRFPEAASAFRRAVELQPDFAAANYHLGQALEQQGNSAEAVAAYLKSIELTPESVAARCDLARTYRRMNATEKALAELTEAVRRQPRFAPARRDLAWVLATCAEPELRDHTRALAEAEAALMLSDRSPEFQRVVGVARYRSGNLSGAITALREAARRPGGDAYAWLFLAMAHQGSNDPAGAKVWFDRFARWEAEGRQWVSAHPITRDQIARFRGEAAELLGLEKPPRPRPPVPRCAPDS
jgi:serine/threonine protein kinase/tetratricopeptide (TPR) repeat protein